MRRLAATAAHVGLHCLPVSSGQGPLVSPWLGTRCGPIPCSFRDTRNRAQIHGCKQRSHWCPSYPRACAGAGVRTCLTIAFLSSTSQTRPSSLHAHPTHERGTRHDWSLALPPLDASRRPALAALPPSSAPSSGTRAPTRLPTRPHAVALRRPAARRSTPARAPLAPRHPYPRAAPLARRAPAAPAPLPAPWQRGARARDGGRGAGL